MMKRSKKDIEALITELWDYSFNDAKKWNDKRDTEDLGTVYKIGKADGFHEAVNCIYLQLYGGKKMLNRWLGATGLDNAEKWLKEAFPEDNND